MAYVLIVSPEVVNRRNIGYKVYGYEVYKGIGESGFLELNGSTQKWNRLLAI